MSLRASSPSQAAWRQMLRDAFGVVELDQKLSSPVDASLRHFPIANMKMIEAVSDAKIARRTSRNIATDNDEYFILILVREGKLRITQFDRSCDLAKGNFGLFHLSSPSFYVHQEKTRVLDLKIPASTLCSYIRDPYRHLAVARSAHDGVGRVAADFLCSLAEEQINMPEWAVHACAGQLMSVVATAIECDDRDAVSGGPAIRAAIFKRAVAYIETNIGNPDLNIKSVAQFSGISVRYLQKAFNEQGVSAGDLIRDCRLRRCHESLVNADVERGLVKEIAFKSGFRSASHFSTVFKRRYGVPPNTLRKVGHAAD